MTSIYILREDCLLLLYRVGSRVVEPSWCGVGGHFEPEELNRPDLCILRELEEETGITPQDITPPELRYITLRLKTERCGRTITFRTVEQGRSYIARLQ